IRYAIPIDATVRLSVFDVLGREIKVLVDATQPAGWYALEWNGTDDKNNLVPSGVYFYRLMVKDVELTKKMMIVR
ncbi:MAG: FlgD immunoglobulin-like domain containing protein, partial [Bacteroidota bacterium]